jgi:hypothetical protein
MNVVFATTTAVVAHPQSGASVGVAHGTHWPADDPIVLAYPTHFSDDARYGLSSSRPLRDDGFPVGYEGEEPAPPAPTEQATNVPGEKRAGRGRRGAGQK